MQQNYFKKLLRQNAGAYGNNIEKKSQRPHPKLEIFII